MALVGDEIVQLNRVITALQKIVVQNSKTRHSAFGKPISKQRRRVLRSGKELIAFRKMLVAERKRGVPVVTLAKQHGISTTYIYQL